MPNNPFQKGEGASPTQIRTSQPLDDGPAHQIADKPASQYKAVEKSQERAADKALALKADAAGKLQTKQLDALNQIASFDWKAVPPPMLAQMLIQMPFKGGSGEPDYFLAPWQAMVFAMRCFELGLSPFSNEVWFNPKNNKVNVTFEGKLKLARKQGMNLGPPRFEKVLRTLPKPDWGYKCQMTTGRADDKAEYTAWYSEWNVPRSPVWKEKPDHMLQLRAAEKCLSFASGIGSSELMGEQDLQVGEEAAKVMGTSASARDMPEVSTTEFTFVAPQTNKEMEK